MPGTTYALLVGIDDYAAGLDALQGCVNDVRNFRSYLEGRFDGSNLALEVLENGDATRSNVIDRFDKHLGRAKPGDAALFVFCGYGAHSPSIPAFRAHSLGGQDEGLVLHDSRVSGNPDLADKELAALLHRLSPPGERGPHVSLILDCCHTGSRPKAGDERARFTKPGEARDLDDYLDGFFGDRGSDLDVPRSKHISMAACNRSQTARERGDEGLFSRALMNVLNSPTFSIERR
jgi:hypothetical protein